MVEYINPPTLPKPSADHTQGVIHAGNARRLVMSGQVGRKADGTVLEGLEAQTEQVFDNIFALVAAAGMKPTDIIKLVTYTTERDGKDIIRGVRKRKLYGHEPASTYIVVPALAQAHYLIEIEGEAVSEATGKE